MTKQQLLALTTLAALPVMTGVVQMNSVNQIPRLKPAGASTVVVLVEIREYQSTLLSEPLLSTGRLLSWYSLAWLIIVLALMLRTIDRLSFGATLTASLTLVSVFAAGPLLGRVATAIR